MVYDVRGIGAEVAGAIVDGGNAGLVGVGRVVHRLEIVGEVEELVLLDRTTDVASHLVICDMPNRRIEKASGTHGAVLQIPVRRAVITIRARLEYDIADSAGAAS